MLDLFEINDSFEDLFDFSDFNSEDEAPILQNSEEDLNFLDVFFEPLIVINQDQSSTTPNSSLIRFYHQLKNNQFKDATQTIRDHPHCLQQMNNSLPVTKLVSFFLFLLRIRKRLTPIIKSMWESANSPLQHAVQTLDDIKLTELTEKVLSSSKTGKSEFITIFLNFISNKPILEACLNKRIDKKQSAYVKNQATSLNIRLASMGSSSAPLIMDHLQTYHVENRETSLIDNNITLPSLNNDDNELNELLDELIADEKETTAHSNSAPLINNSLFNKNNKRPHQVPLGRCCREITDIFVEKSLKILP